MNPSGMAKMRPGGWQGSKLIGGVAGWMLGRLKTGGHRSPRLELVERIALAPRQSLALVEAEGRRFLVATSSEGAPSFYALDERASVARLRALGNSTAAARQTARVSW